MIGLADGTQALDGARGLQKRRGLLRLRAGRPIKVVVVARAFDVFADGQYLYSA